MMRRFPTKKVYGEPKLRSCPFCGKMATRKTETGLEVCPLHTKEQIQEIKCTCGSWLEQRAGKFGPYFNCLNCGNINFNKAMEIKAITSSVLAAASHTEESKIVPPTENAKVSKGLSDSQDSKEFQSSRESQDSRFSQNKFGQKKETIITSRDVEYFD